MSKRFGEAMRLMRRRNGQDRETGFAMLKPHAAEHLDELIDEFHREEDDQGLRAWLLELIGEARDPRALPLLVAHLDDECFEDWGIWGLEKLDTKEARTALYRHRANKHT